ncbi:MAG: TonB-dependent receptor [Myxococcales bacterium]|nr:TonB-dependent receptor [Myxococcales bacterium]
MTTPTALRLATSSLLVVSLAFARPTRAQDTPTESVPTQPAPEPTAPQEPTDSQTAPPPKVEAVSDGLTVVGKRRHREKRTSVHSVGEGQLERLNQDDPHAVLNQVPGVYTRQEDGLGLRPNIGTRGVNPDRSKKITLLEDDVLFGPAPYSAPAAYFFPLITRMTNVEVIKGAGSIAFGPQTVAGAVNVRTRDLPTGWAGGIDLAAGQYAYGKAHAHVGAGFRHFGFLLEGVHLRTDGFKELDGGGDTGFSRNEWMLKTRYLFNPGAETTHTLRAKLGYSDETSNETYLGLTTADFRAKPLRRYAASQLDHMEWHRTQAELRYEIENRNFDLVTTAYRHDLSRVWNKINGFETAQIVDVLRNPTTPRNIGFYNALRNTDLAGFASQRLLIGPNDRDFVSQGIQTRGHLRGHIGGYRNQLEFAARLHHDEAARVHTENTYQFVGGVLTLVPDTFATTANDVQRTLAVSLYAGDELELGKLTLKPGLRMELIRSQFRPRRVGSNEPRIDNEDAVFLPGLGAHYQLSRGLAVVAGVHRGYSPPSPRDLAAQAEQSTNFDAGLRYERGLYRAEVIGFWNEYENLTAICTESSGCLDADVGNQTNAGGARIRGFEVFGQTEYRRGQTTVPLVLAYTFTHAQFLESFASNDPIFGSVTAGDDIPYVPRHQLSVTAGVERPLGGLTLSLLHVSQMYDAPASQLAVAKTDNLTVIDAGAHLNLPRNAQIYLQVRNALDEAAIVSFRPFGARPNAPRWVQAGARWTF